MGADVISSSGMHWKKRPPSLAVLWVFSKVDELDGPAGSMASCGDDRISTVEAQLASAEGEWGCPGSVARLPSSGGTTLSSILSTRSIGGRLADSAAQQAVMSTLRHESSGGVEMGRRRPELQDKKACTASVPAQGWRRWAGSARPDATRVSEQRQSWRSA